MNAAVRRPRARSARIWSRGTRTSAWMPVKKNSPWAAVYLASRSSISVRPDGNTSVIDAPFSTSAVRGGYRCRRRGTWSPGPAPTRLERGSQPELDRHDDADHGHDRPQRVGVEEAGDAPAQVAA